ncbi:transcriptional regulator [Xanthomonas phaseoli pv. phaseoli]|uniref:Transcriptional regulator n=1 Tax=Xanthomonas campestris pv. phaseoli TaxID=317013 RepID=A0AB34QJ53_XANCH|nr:MULTISPECIES: helix-turn-helix transcriptional regulator [Xanthomonas]ATS91161.1 helix-turn-helix transcriptional regulator [Xanthomonas citri pv. phaseoli var. fuscans]KHS36676.1 transcriptional regulator [Xanthomonas phaseoli pv. phaseoli]TBW92900.1 transcriptional regulator [Xanthomonas citri pv. aurantifolii]
MPRRRDTVEQDHGDKPVAAARLIFAKNFRKARIAAKLTQRDVRDKTGFAQSWVSEIETGKMSITIDNMDKLAHCVSVPLWQLLVPS